VEDSSKTKADKISVGLMDTKLFKKTTVITIRKRDVSGRKKLAKLLKGKLGCGTACPKRETKEIFLQGDQRKDSIPYLSTELKVPQNSIVIEGPLPP